MMTFGRLSRWTPHLCPSRGTVLVTGQRLGQRLPAKWRMPALGELLTCERSHARECFLTQIPAGWESNARQGRGEYEISCRDEEGGRRQQLTGQVKGMNKVCGLCGFYRQSEL